MCIRGWDDSSVGDFSRFRLCSALAIGCGPLLVQEARGQTPSGRDLARPVVADEPRGAGGVLSPGDSGGDPGRAIRGTAIVSPGTRRTRPLSRGAGCSGRGRCSSRAGPPPSTASSGFGSSGARWTRARVGSTAVRPWCSTTARHRRVYADNRDEIRQVAPGYSWA